jgi:hypothetical protein
MDSLLPICVFPHLWVHPPMDKKYSEKEKIAPVLSMCNLSFSLLVFNQCNIAIIYTALTLCLGLQYPKDDLKYIWR